MAASLELVMEVVDPLVQFQDNHESRTRELLTSLLQVGLSCTTQSPRDRMDMRDVGKKIHAIREAYVGLDIMEQTE